MKLTEEQLKQIFQQQAARSTARQVDCFTEEQFARAASGSLASHERSAVARHLIACADCAEEYRIVRSLRPWANEAEQVLVGTMPVASHLEALPLPSRSPAIASPALMNGLTAFFSARGAMALAAMLFLVLFAGVWLVWNRQEHNRELARLNQQLAERDRALNSAQESLGEKQRRLDELETSARSQYERPDGRRPEETGTPSVSARTGGDKARIEDEIASLRREIDQPQLEVPIVDLDPSPVRGGSSSATFTIDIPPTAKSFTAILNFSGETYSSYEVEILDTRGRRLWSGQVRGKGESRSINLTLSRSLIANGNYLIKLYGLKDGSRETVAEYPLQVRYQ